MYISWTHSELGVYKNQFPMDSSKWDAAPIPTAGGKETGKQNITFTSEEFLTGYYEGGYGISIVPSVVENAKLDDAY